MHDKFIIDNFLDTSSSKPAQAELNVVESIESSSSSTEISEVARSNERVYNTTGYSFEAGNTVADSIKTLPPIENENVNTDVKKSSCPFKAAVSASSGCPFKAFTLNCFSTGELYSDSLHHKAKDRDGYGCTENLCKGSIWKQKTIKQETIKEDSKIVIEEILDFLDQYYESINQKNSIAHKIRASDLVSEYKHNGIHYLTSEELDFACKTAWRNAARCIGRINWACLKLLDYRHLKTTREMFEALCEVIKYATNNGSIRPSIAVFQQKTDPKREFRIWNPELFNYAGYKISETEWIGDAANFELTKICQKLGWKGKGTEFDMLPLVLQANGQKPEIFEIPEELIMEIPLVHPNPEYKHFNDLKLKWFALPAVSAMCLDAGGIYFNCNSIIGWYVTTEIARNLLEPNRYNKLEIIGRCLNLDMKNNTTFWKDRVSLELNFAIAHSFALNGATIIDHHTVAESFKIHMENEIKLRGGTNGDWVWLNTPMNSNLTPTFGMEMLNYVIKPYFEYQEPPCLSHKKIKFKTLIKSVSLFLYKLNHKLIKNRKKCLILYGSQTGKSEKFAEIADSIFKKVFRTKLSTINNYDFDNLNKEDMVLIVASSTGNGEAPTNAQTFEHIIENYKRNGVIDSTFKKDFKNTRFSVLGLGNSNYAKFCEFPKSVYSFLKQVGLKEVHGLITADELWDEEKSCYQWLRETFKSIINEFHSELRVKEEEIASILNSKELTKNKLKLRIKKLKNEKINLVKDHITNLSSIFDKEIMKFELVEKFALVKENDANSVLKLTLRSVDHKLQYKPGDHLEIYPKNPKKYVDFIIEKLKESDDSLDADVPYLFEALDHESTIGHNEFWYMDKNFPPMTIRDALTYYFDITTPLSQEALKEFSILALDEKDKRSLDILANDQTNYEEWRLHYPNIADTLKYFPSIKLDITILLAELPRLKGRFYSISSSHNVAKNDIDITLGIIEHYSNFHKAHHYGVCSKFLNDLHLDEIVPATVRNGLKFQLPHDKSIPIIMICAGTGIAPFRGFWMERYDQMKNHPTEKFGKFVLFFGFRDHSKYFLYKDEINHMINKKVITNLFTAASRELPNKEKKYIQTKLVENSNLVFDLLTKQNGEIYVCGRRALAEGVYSSLIDILTKLNYTEDDAVKFLDSMKIKNKYHEDVFTI